MLNVSALVSALCFLLFSIATCGPVRSADPSAINLGSRADPHLAGVVSGVAWRDENGTLPNPAMQRFSDICQVTSESDVRFAISRRTTRSNGICICSV